MRKKPYNILRSNCYYILEDRDNYLKVCMKDIKVVK